MLKKIAPLISPELIKILMEMGHTDEIVICDGNMPACTLGKRVVRLDGHNVPEILKAILELMPLDPTVEQPAAMALTLRFGTNMQRSSVRVKRLTNSSMASKCFPLRNSTPQLRTPIA